jgi:hypothetical protein
MSANEYANQYIGHGAIQCGDVQHHDNPENTENCIFKYIKENKPFYAWYWLEPIDSVPAAGILYNSNKELSIAWYDRGYSITGNTFNATKCTSWQIRTSSDKNQVICVIPKTAKVYLFGLESFLQLIYE